MNVKNAETNGYHVQIESQKLVHNVIAVNGIIKMIAKSINKRNNIILNGKTIPKWAKILNKKTSTISGTFYWKDTSSISNDDGIVITPTSTTGNGRWIRIKGTEINPRWYDKNKKVRIQGKDKPCTSQN